MAIVRGRQPRAPALVLPSPGPSYNRENEAQTRRLIEQLFIRFGESRDDGQTASGIHFRQNITIPLPELEAEKEYTGTVAMSGTAALYTVEVDFPMWLRIYESEQAMIDDEERALEDDPTTPVVLEVLWLEDDETLAPVVLRSADGSGFAVLGATRETDDEFAPQEFWYKVVLPDFSPDLPALAATRATVYVDLFPVNIECCNEDCDPIESERLPLTAQNGGFDCGPTGGVLFWQMTYNETNPSGPSRYNFREDSNNTFNVGCDECATPCEPTPSPCPGANPVCQPTKTNYTGKYMPPDGTPYAQVMPVARPTIRHSSPDGCGAYSENWFGRPRKNMKMQAPIFRYTDDGSQDAAAFVFGMPPGSSDYDNLQVHVIRDGGGSVGIDILHVDEDGVATVVATDGGNSHPGNTTRHIEVVICNDKISVWYGSDPDALSLVHDEVTIPAALLGDDGMLRNSDVGYAGSRGGGLTVNTGISPSGMLYTPLSEDAECEVPAATGRATITFLPLEDPQPDE